MIPEYDITDHEFVVFAKVCGFKVHRDTPPEGWVVREDSIVGKLLADLDAYRLLAEHDERSSALHLDI